MQIYNSICKIIQCPVACYNHKNTLAWSYGDMLLVVLDKEDHHMTQIFITFFWNDTA